MAKRTIGSFVIMIATLLAVCGGFFVAPGVTHAASYC